MKKLFGRDEYFYHASIRRYVSLFGSLFTDMCIKRKSSDGTREDIVEVPIKYGNGNVYSKVAQDASRETGKVSRILPAMAFELTTFYKDTARKTNPSNILKGQTFDADGKQNYQLNRVPYNFLFNLYVRTKNIDDALQIVEQIVPAFDGNLAVTIEDIPIKEINAESDIVIKLEEIKSEDNYQDEMQSRVVEYTITFELKGFLYKRTQSAFVFKEIDVISRFDFGDSISNPTSLLALSESEPTTESTLSKGTSEIESDLFSGLAPVAEPKSTRKTRKGK